MRALRIIEYEGDDPWVEETLQLSLDGTYHVGAARITAVRIPDEYLGHTHCFSRGFDQDYLADLIDEARGREAGWPRGRKVWIPSCEPIVSETK